METNEKKRRERKEDRVSERAEAYNYVTNGVTGMLNASIDLRAEDENSMINFDFANRLKVSKHFYKLSKNPLKLYPSLQEIRPRKFFKPKVNEIESHFRNLPESKQCNYFPYDIIKYVSEDLTNRYNNTNFDPIHGNKLTSLSLNNKKVLAFPSGELGAELHLQRLEDDNKEDNYMQSNWNPYSFYRFSTPIMQLSNQDNLLCVRQMSGFVFIELDRSENSITYKNIEQFTLKNSPIDISFNPLIKEELISLDEKLNVHIWDLSDFTSKPLEIASPWENDQNFNKRIRPLGVCKVSYNPRTFIVGDQKQLYILDHRTKVATNQVIKAKHDDLFWGFDINLKNRFSIAISSTNGLSLYDLRYLKNETFNWKYPLRSTPRPNIKFHQCNEILKDIECISTWGFINGINIHPLEFTSNSAISISDPFTIHPYSHYLGYNESEELLTSQSTLLNFRMSHNTHWELPSIPFLEGVAFDPISSSMNEMPAFNTFMYHEDGSIHKLKYTKQKVNCNQNLKVYDPLIPVEKLSDLGKLAQDEAFNKSLNRVKFRLSNKFDFVDIIEDCISQSIELCSITSEGNNADHMTPGKEVLDPINSFDFKYKSSTLNPSEATIKLKDEPIMSTTKYNILNFETTINESPTLLEEEDYIEYINSNLNQKNSEIEKNAFCDSTKLLARHLKESLTCYQSIPAHLSMNCKEHITPTSTSEKLEEFWEKEYVSDDSEIENDEQNDSIKKVEDNTNIKPITLSQKAKTQPLATRDQLYGNNTQSNNLGLPSHHTQPLAAREQLYDTNSQTSNLDSNSQYIQPINATRTILTSQFSQLNVNTQPSQFTSSRISSKPFSQRKKARKSGF